MKNPMNTPAPVHFRDGAGHVAARYVADLKARSQASAERKPPVAFFDADLSRDALAEELGEAFVRTATSGEDEEEDRLDQVVPEELGGPFVETTSEREFAYDTDASNPEEATREPFPRT